VARVVEGRRRDPRRWRAMAAQISTMLAFDYVTGNWDRWSGGNVGYDRKKSELLFIDNDGAFFDPLPAKEVKRSVDFFDGVERFSRAFVTALRAVDLAKAFGEESRRAAPHRAPGGAGRRAKEEGARGDRREDRQARREQRARVRVARGWSAARASPCSGTRFR